MPRQPTDISHLRPLLGQVNINSSVAVYVQLENMVRFGIASGKLKAGDQLPSVRELSEWLEVNPNTVAKAYRDLEVMGLVYTRRGRGIYVNKGVQGRCNDKARTEIVTRAFEVCSEAKASGMTNAAIKEAARECYKSTAAPYAAVPKEIMELARKK